MTPENYGKSKSLVRLRRSWFGFLLFSAGILSIGFIVLLVSSHVQSASLWLGKSSLALILFLWMLWGLLKDNYTIETNTFSPIFGAGTNLTILRGIIIALLMGFLFSTRPDNWIIWVPGSFFTLAVFADYIDGYLARLTNHTTRLGEKLDTNLDGWTILVGSILIIQYGQAPWWYIFVGLARFIFIGGIWIRQQLELPVYSLGDSVRRRAFAGAQMGLIAVLLLPIFSPPGTYWAASLFALPFILGFLLDWARVIGFPFSELLQKLPHKPVDNMIGKNPALLRDLAFIKKWFPVFLRLTSVSLLIISFWSTSQDISATIQTATLSGNTSQLITIALMLLFMLLAILGLLLGAAGRIAALGVLFAVGIHQHLFTLTSLDILLIVCACAVFFLGTGPVSLWQPENRLIYRRAGQNRTPTQLGSRKNEKEICAQDPI